MSSEIFQLRNSGKLNPVIPAGGSWALGRFGRLFPSGEDSVEEGKSLLLMFLGFHSFCYDTTPFFPKNPFRSSKVLVSELYVWECSTTVGWKTGVLTLCSPAHGVGVSKEDSRTEDWTLNLTGLVWVDFHKWHQIELIVIKNLSNGGNW